MSNSKYTPPFAGALPEELGIKSAWIEAYYRRLQLFLPEQDVQGFTLLRRGRIAASCDFHPYTGSGVADNACPTLFSIGHAPGFLMWALTGWMQEEGLLSLKEALPKDVSDSLPLPARCYTVESLLASEAKEAPAALNALLSEKASQSGGLFSYLQAHMPACFFSGGESAEEDLRGMRLFRPQTALFGQILQNGGRWEEREILSAEWMKTLEWERDESPFASCGMRAGKYGSLAFFGAYGQTMLWMRDEEAVLVIGASMAESYTPPLTEAFYETVLIPMTAGKVVYPTDSGANRRLADKLETARVVNRYSNPSPLEAYLNGFCFRGEEYSLTGLSSVSFSFEYDLIAAQMELPDGSRLSLSAGRVTEKYTTVPDVAPYLGEDTHGEGVFVATACFDSASRLTVTARLLSGPLVLRLCALFGDEDADISLEYIRGGK